MTGCIYSISTFSSLDTAVVGLIGLSILGLLADNAISDPAYE